VDLVTRLEVSAPGVDVWLARLEPPFLSEVALPPAERERGESFLRLEVGERWTASRRALRQVLSGYLDEPPAEIAIELGEHGKPRLEGESDLEFNLSHSGDIALVAVSQRRPVGVDVERIEPTRDLLALAERALGPEDVAKVRSAASNKRPAVFYESWVRHEARLKCLGAGLTGPVSSVAMEVQNLDVAPGYAAAVAVATR
jgi:4'-phosphopantetheinyl transferase